MSHAQFAVSLKSHIESLSAVNTDDKYKEMLSLLQPKYAAFDLWLDKQDKTITTRKGKTRSLNEIIQDFITFVKNEVFKEVSYRFEKSNAEIFNEFFPNGVTEYNRLNKKTATVLFDRIEKACTAHKAELLPGLDTKAIQFNADFDACLTKQLNSKATVKDTSSEGDKLRQEVSQVLYLNLLKQLTLHADNPKQVLDLYDSSFLKKKKRKANMAVVHQN